MFIVSNKMLSVSILDPENDRSHFGSRYCTGGYIWQVDDSKWGPLFSGPHYPEPDPSPFDGQGLPEAFVIPLGDDYCTVGEHITVIGVGTVIRTSNITPFHVRDNPEVEQFCRWKVVASPHKIQMATLQTSHTWCINIERTIELDEYVIYSRTEIENKSPGPLPLCWFAHPFFPLNHDLRCSTINFPWSVGPNSGFLKDGESVLCMRETYPWKKGLFMKLDIPSNTLFSASVIHPNALSIEITTDYWLDSLPIWANDKTFSLEPYLSRIIPSGERTAWMIAYRIHHD